MLSIPSPTRTAFDRATAARRDQRQAARALRVVGIALSPEFVYAIRPGALADDPKRYAVLWMDRAASPPPSSSRVRSTTSRCGCSRARRRPPRCAAVDRILAPYGGLRRDRAQGPDLESNPRRRARSAASAGRNGADRVPGRRRVPDQHRARPPDRASAAGDRDAQGGRLHQRRGGRHYLGAGRGRHGAGRVDRRRGRGVARADRTRPVHRASSAFPTSRSVLRRASSRPRC